MIIQNFEALAMSTYTKLTMEYSYNVFSYQKGPTIKAHPFKTSF